MGHEKVAIIGKWPLYGGQNEWGKALLGLTKVAFIERWPFYRVATIDRLHCIGCCVNVLCRQGAGLLGRGRETLTIWRERCCLEWQRSED